MRRNYIKLNTNVRRYIPLQIGDSKFRVECVEEGIYKLEEAIPFGSKMICISFLVTNNGKILSPVANNYFESLDSCSSMAEYQTLKKELLLKIKDDMEQKRFGIQEDLKR